MKILVAGWDSGGGVEAVQTVVGRAVARGHQVRVLGTEGLRSRFESAGATFVRYRCAPDDDVSRPETGLVKGWQSRNPVSQWRRVRDRQLVGPARELCRDVAGELQREAADVAVVDTMVPAAMFGPEVSRVRAVIVMRGPYMIPRAGVSPLGTGWRPGKGPLGRLRDRSAAAVTLAVFRSWVPGLIRTRAEVGLPPVRDLPGLMARADRVLVCSSPSYDFGSGSVPASVRYVGPQLEDHPGQAAGRWAGPPGRPLVLVGLSSTVMRQEGLLQRAAGALGQLPVRGLVTTGPAVDPAVICAPANVAVTRWVRHADVLPHCSAVITHGGHGTVMKALIAGVPLVVVPLGRDQPGNAGRVVHAGAGTRLRKNATASALRTAVSRVTDDPRYRAAARPMAARLASERDDNRVVDELEQAAARGPATGHPTPGKADSG